MEPHPDQHYLDAIRDNNSAVIQRLIAENYPPIRGWVVRNGGSAADAQDVLGDALEAICRKLSKGEAIVLTARFSTFLFRICQNHWFKKLRQKKPSDEGVSDDLIAVLNLNTDDLNWLEATEESERMQFCRDKLAKLGDACKKLLALVWSENPPSMQAIADQLGYKTANAASQRKFQCIETLKKIAGSDPRFGEF